MSNTVKFRKRQYKICLEMHMRRFRESIREIHRRKLAEKQRQEEKAQVDNGEYCKGGVNNE